MTLMELITNITPSILRAGKSIMDVYNKGTVPTFKSDGSPITEADKVSEKIILNQLKITNPELPIVSEETSESHYSIDSKMFFLVDPLDGTKEFLKKDGKGSFTVNVGLIENNIPIMGIVYAPAHGQLFYGAKGFGSWKIYKGKKTKISICTPQKNKITAVASISHRDLKTNNWLRENKINKIISIGSSLKFCLVASGQADVYPRFGPTMEWDTAAGDAILRAAGGTVTDSNFLTLDYGKNFFKNGPFIAWGGYNNIKNNQE